MAKEILQISIIFMIFIGLFLVTMQIVSARNLKKTKEKIKALQEALKPGVEVMLLGGIYGKLVKLDKDTALIEIADNTEIKVDRSSIQAIVKN
ncbi:preprotein translocase subunit YajC [Anaerococcus sp. Marseille-P3625]|uniref:preprotein translocase subunit YajC n=1 Tax=Anaerococcus sp. Marseille-P3625 TaxID=1977277 RepID=UPI000C08A51F|nr:preprotein translocase subunit YajC [Anaerococcus sp. Marseille-P3625]